MSEHTTTAGTGISFAGLLTLLFIGLKLGGVIAWSWWWVLAPLWIGWLVAFAVMGIALLFVLVFALFASAMDR